MTDNYQLGRMICLVSYVLLGLTVIIFSLVSGVDSRETAWVTALTWLVGFLILHFTNGPEKKIRKRFCILNILFTTVFELQLCVLFKTPHILFMMYLVQWIATVFFLDRSLCTYSLVVDLVIVAALFWLPIPLFSSFTVVEFIGGVIGLILAYWISVWMMRTVDHQHGILLEQEQSLKDFLKVLEAKCDELSRVKREGVSGEGGSFPEVEGVDWDFALRHVKDAGMLYDILSNAIALRDAEKQKLMRCYEDRDVEQYRIQVHSMKNSAAMIGAHEVASLAKLLEQAARDNDMVRIERMHALFLSEWDALYERLAVLVPEESENASALKQPYEPTMVRALMVQLLEAVEDVDVDRADEVLNCLLQIEFPRDKADITDRLKQAVLNIDEDEVKQLTEELGA